MEKKSEAELEKQRLDFEKEKESYWRARTETKRRDEMYIHGVRALIILNGGGAVALLAFLGQVWAKSEALPSGVIFGMSSLVAGCFFTGTLHFLRYYTSLHWSREIFLPLVRTKIKIGKWLASASLLLAGVSLACFLVGMTFVISAAHQNFREDVDQSDARASEFNSRLKGSKYNLQQALN